MRWPWQRRVDDAAERTAEAVAEAQARLRRAQQQTSAIVRRADRLARELPPGEFVARVASAFNKSDH